jgi:hypothetical protein
MWQERTRGTDIPEDFRWAMVYHHGLPVATCPVEAVSDDHLTLMCGPLAFERRAWLSVSLSRAPDDGSLAENRSVSGEVESVGAHRLSIRIEPETLES